MKQHFEHWQCPNLVFILHKHFGHSPRGPSYSAAHFGVPRGPRTLTCTKSGMKQCVLCKAVKFGRGKVSQKLARPCKPRREKGNYAMLCVSKPKIATEPQEVPLLSRRGRQALGGEGTAKVRLGEAQASGAWPRAPACFLGSKGGGGSKKDTS